MELRGNVALVTGGAQGLGEATCEALAAVGVNVIVADLRLSAAEKMARRLSERGGRALAVGLDVGDETQARNAIGQALQQCGALHFLINNAGIDQTAPIEELGVAAWDRIVQTNLRGPFLMSKFAFPIMREQGRGHIVNIVSTAAKRNWANASAYHASKWGLLGLSHALHVEGRLHGIKVTAMVCGGMRTPFLLERFPDLDPHNLQDPKNVAETIRFVLGQPDETVIPEVMVLPIRETSWP